MQDYDGLSRWHFEAEVGEMRGIVALGEKGGIAALRVKFAEGGVEFGRVLNHTVSTEVAS